MAVCVVCLLCAEHLPCKEHLESSFTDTKIFVPGAEHLHKSYQSASGNNLYNSDLRNDNSISIENLYTKRRGRTKSIENVENISATAVRTKRHTTHNHQQHHHDGDSSHLGYDENSKIFLKKIFQQFGDADGTTMNLVGFEKMLRHLNLYRLIEEKIPKNETLINTSNESCISSLDLISRVSSNNPVIIHDIEHGDKTNDTIKTHIHKDVLVNSNDLYNICPILLYHLAAPTSLERSGCINDSLITSKIHHFENLTEVESRFYVWVYAIASILGVSLVGLLGVAVIPCMDKHFYKHVIQFLVALAVGTLAGDALLHLLPHSMMTFSSEEEGHSSMTWKGLVAVLGIIFFYATERGLTMIAEWRKSIERQEKPSSRVRVMRDPDSASVNNVATDDKQCKHKYSSYPYCYDEIAMDTKEDHYHHHNQQVNSNLKSIQESLSPAPINNKKNNTYNSYNNSNKNDHIDHNETAQSLLRHNYNISDNYSGMNKENSCNNPDNTTLSTNLDEGSVENDKEKKLVREETYTIILREHESTHHGHSHKHGHVHSPPRSLSAVAWMVVMGDGLHNFTDGMAIGAAFSNNIAGGFSTAIAVFCHELPHELGDFAVLLKAGMSAKQAVYYNLLSSVLSFLGMILGIIIGDTPEASAWVFACAAGMFIYIALVDMMPELTSAHSRQCALSQCMLQLLGMSCGLGIMLVIALYEDALKQIFTTAPSYSHHHH